MPYSDEFQRLTWQFLYSAFYLRCFTEWSYTKPWLTVAIPLIILYTSIICLLVGILLKHLVSSIIFENMMPRAKCAILAEGILMTRMKWHANIIFTLFCIIPLQKIRLRISRNHFFPSFFHNPNTLFATSFAVVCSSEAFVFNLFTVVLLPLSWKVLINLEFISV